MEEVTVIIDFDNYFGVDVSRLNPQILEFSFTEIVNLCERRFSSFNSINIRLYGGWFKETTFTKQASSIQQLLADINVFPKVSKGKVINGTIELAVSLLLEPNFIWSYTHKETDGISRIRINHECVDTVCNDNRTNCPKFILHKFTDSKEKKCGVTGCVNLQKNVFKRVEQKMVDTLIACDIVSAALNESSAGIFVISDDQDHFPSLALATVKKSPSTKSIILGLTNEQKFEFITSFLNPFNIQTILVYDSRRN